MKRLAVKLRSNCSIQGRQSINTTITARILGTSTNVCSWICVTAWKMLTRTPTTRPASNGGAARSRAVCKERADRSIRNSGVIQAYSPLLETACEGADNQMPAIYQHKQHQFEGQGNECWRHH